MSYCCVDLPIFVGFIVTLFVSVYQSIILINHRFRALVLANLDAGEDVNLQVGGVVNRESML